MLVSQNIVSVDVRAGPWGVQTAQCLCQCFTPIWQFITKYTVTHFINYLINLTNHHPFSNTFPNLHIKLSNFVAPTVLTEGQTGHVSLSDTNTTW